MIFNRVFRWGRTRKVRAYLRHWAPGLFLKEVLAKPTSVGAICPSSPFLSRAMATPLEGITPLGPNDYIVELGAGTGNVTQALLDAGIPASKLIVIELSNVFAARLRQRFPGVKIIQGSATDLPALLPQNISVRAVISSLPLCSLPQAVTRTIVEHWRNLLGAHQGILVQFTYNLGRPGWVNYIQARTLSTRMVWLNIPPARVSCYVFPPITAPAHDYTVHQPDTNQH